MKKHFKTSSVGKLPILRNTHSNNDLNSEISKFVVAMSLDTVAVVPHIDVISPVDFGRSLTSFRSPASYS